MSGFVKLYQSILDSSIWLEPDHVRITWLTMLAMADQFGQVTASVRGLAHRARVTDDACRAALEVLMAPDQDSKDPAFDGRRIEKAPDGWLVLNHEKYREMRTKKQIDTARRVQKHRDNKRVTGNDVTPSTPRSDQIRSDQTLPSGEKKAPPAPSRPRRRVATREDLETYRPGAGELESIRRIGANPERLVEAWRNHHLAKGTEIVDIAASLRTWIAREPSFAPAPRPGKRPEAPGLTEHRRSGGRGDEGSARPEQAEWKPTRTGSPVRPGEALGLISNTLNSLGGTRE